MSERSERGDYTAAARRAGAARAAALEGVGPALGSLADLRDAMDGPTMLALVEEHTELMLQDARSRAHAIGTSGSYPGRIHKKVFSNADGYAGTVFVIPKKGWAKNVPLWLEYGTRRMLQAYSHLLPALAAAREQFNRAVEALLSRAVPQ